MKQASSIKKEIKADQFWLSLDNAAKIYPATLDDEITTVFRITAVLKERVNIQALMKAVSRAEGRFPYYKLRLKKGFFWFYLEHKPGAIRVMVDEGIPCRKFPRKGLMLRVLARENRLSVEFSHILTDGSGAFEFLKTILSLYFAERGVSFSDEFDYLKPGERISEEEYEDAYKRYFKEGIPPMVKRAPAFHLPMPLNSRPRFHVKYVSISVKKIKKKATEYGVSITNYLVAVYLYVLQEIFEEMSSFQKRKNNKYLRVQVPVNLRNILPSGTMRNFSLFVLPEIDLRLGHYTFQEIIKTVYHQMRLETDEKLIHKNIARNVGSEKKIYIKSIPLMVKSFILKLKYYSLGTSQYSGVITNLGRTMLPDKLASAVDHFIFTPPPPNKMLKVNCGIISHGDKLVLSFGNTTRSMELEEKFVAFLESEGIEPDANN
jgi:NRPS condensation-like uncharacterized protein